MTATTPATPSPTPKPAGTFNLATGNTAIAVALIVLGLITVGTGVMWLRTK